MPSDQRSLLPLLLDGIRTFIRRTRIARGKARRKKGSRQVQPKKSHPQQPGTGLLDLHRQPPNHPLNLVPSSRFFLTLLLATHTESTQGYTPSHPINVPKWEGPLGPYCSSNDLLV